MFAALPVQPQPRRPEGSGCAGGPACVRENGGMELERVWGVSRSMAMAGRCDMRPGRGAR
jgi:hypothetical protein